MMEAFFAASPRATPGFGEVARPWLGSMHANYVGLPSNASCEVLIEVHASSINPCDERPRISSDSYPKVFGSDVAGIVVNVSSMSECTQLRVGDRVWGDIGANTRTKAGATKELGGYGQYAVALEAQLGKMPRSMGFAEAGALPKVALTSYKALAWYADAAQWPANASILILGGSGGCGSAGIQLAKALGRAKARGGGGAGDGDGSGAHVTTTTSAANAAYVRGLGADAVIDYHTRDWWDADVVADDSMDVVYDTVGEPQTGSRAMRKLRPGGRYVTITGALAPLVRPGRHQSMFINSDTNLASAPLMAELTDLAEAGRLHMRRLDASYGLRDVAKGFARSRGGHVVGKLSVVVKPSP